jgi:hypothetical protein
LVEHPHAEDGNIEECEAAADLGKPRPYGLRVESDYFVLFLLVFLQQDLSPCPVFNLEGPVKDRLFEKSLQFINLAADLGVRLAEPFLYQIHQQVMLIPVRQLYRPPGWPHLALLVIVIAVIAHVVPGDGENLTRISVTYRVRAHGDKVDAGVAIYVVLGLLPLFLICEDKFESEIVIDESVPRILGVKWVLPH